MAIKEIYRCSDGKEFDNWAEAEEYEEALQLEDSIGNLDMWDNKFEHIEGTKIDLADAKMVAVRNEQGLKVLEFLHGWMGYCFIEDLIQKIKEKGEFPCVYYCEDEEGPWLNLIEVYDKAKGWTDIFMKMEKEVGKWAE